MNIAASRTNQPNTATKQRQGSASTAESLPTDQILRSIREKLGLSGMQSEHHASDRTANSPTSVRNSANASAGSTAASPAKRPSLDLNDHLNDDFDMDMDFGSPQSRNVNQNTSGNASASRTGNKAIEAAYKAYNGAKNYGDMMNDVPSVKGQTTARRDDEDFGAFDDFADYSESSSSVDGENDTTGYSGNVSRFQAVRPTDNEKAPNRSIGAHNKAPTLYGQSDVNSQTSMIVHMLQKELTCYIDSWTDQNQEVVLRCIQNSCDQIAREWCVQNMPSILNECVERWCDTNLENLCASAIHEELNREYKTA